MRGASLCSCLPLRMLRVYYGSRYRCEPTPRISIGGPIFGLGFWTLHNHLVGAGSRRFEGVRSMKTVCLSGRRKRLWWEENIVMLPTPLLQSMVAHGASEDWVRMCNEQDGVE